MTDVKNASLVLKTSDLAVNTISATGACNVNRTVMTWNNINLRTLLGDMYDQYDRFNLCLNAIVTSTAPNPLGDAIDDKAVLVRLSGLPFVNQTYDVATQHNKLPTIIGSINFVANASSTQYFYESSIALFSKNSEACNLTIEYNKVLDGATPNTVNNSVFPQVAFMFKIFGVEDTAAGMKNASRLL